ncbi:penicillin-binding protein 2 [Sporohalobacter salinus]|uniref:penicillin-binding protein 2 n=1 Tax=Sporohalobacter salinus TaxID=1494606 RepID=UPI0030B84827
MNNKFNQRLRYFGIIIIILFMILAGRLFYLQILSGEEYQKLANGNRIHVREIKAPRGKIKTKDGKILVSNRLAYTVSILPRKTNNKLETILERLSQFLDVEVSKLKAKVKKNVNNKSVVLKRDISQKELVILEENKNELPGVIINKVPVRDYVYGRLGSHILGYVGEISANQLKRYKDLGYEVNDIIGKTGLELEYEQYLRGEDGKKQVEVNNLGQKKQTLGIKQPTSGNDLILNIDFELQKIVQKHLEAELKKLQNEAKKDDRIKEPPTGGAVIALNPNTGEVLALTSIPNYDLSLFSGGISSKDWKRLNNNPQRPLLNRAIGRAPPSGSVFKLVTGTAAIEELEVTADSEFYDPGYYQVGDVKFKNWLTGGQGRLDFIDAIAFSNNTVFYKLGHQLYKKDKTLLQKYARKYRLGKKTGVDLPNEKKGLVPGPSWRKENFTKQINQIWLPGYTINLSIGQGNLKTTPIQLVNLVSTIANKGTIYAPQIVDRIVNHQGQIIKDFEPKVMNELSISDSTFEILQAGMEGVTTIGTAGSIFGDLPFAVAGKTGTAQTSSNRSNHAWFAGYAPVDNPQISIVVFIEYGSSSGNTLPVARQIFEDYLVDKEKDGEAEGNDSKPKEKENNI